MIKKKVGSITLAVGLITVGVLLFAANFMELPVKDLYKYWPVLLIGLGLEMILYMALYNRKDENVKLSIDGLCIVFIIVLGIVSGGAGLLNLKDPDFFRGIHIGDGIVDGIKYKSEINETFTRDNVAAGINVKEVMIKNNFGEIKVLPSNSNAIRVEADVSVKFNDESKARQYVKEAIEIKEGETLTIGIKSPLSGSDRKDYAKARADMIVYVPNSVSVKAENSFGDVSAEGVGGDCVLESMNGEVTADHIGGSATLKNAFGDIKARDIGGQVNINNKNGVIVAENIGGAAVLETHFGDVDAAKIGGSLTVINNNGDINVNNIGGKTDIRTAFGDVTAENVGGELFIDNKNGRVEARDIGGNTEIKNAFGDIYYDSDNSDNATIYANTKFGDINSDKHIQINKSGQDITAEGKTGSAAYRIDLRTNNGNIYID